jgi:hypothetical protein
MNIDLLHPGEVGADLGAALLIACRAAASHAGAEEALVGERNKLPAGD